jgi:hypothetical protein
MGVTKMIFVLLISTNVFAQIKNFHPISEQIFRSAAPAKNTAFLAKAGFTHVLIFKNELKGEVASEIRDLQQVGIPAHNIYHIPFRWKDLDALENSCEQVITALSYLVQIEKTRSKKILFHCSMGEDRTGALAGLYRMLYTGWNIDRAFQEEMCAHGYEAGDKGKPWPVVSAVRNEVTPVFLAVASLIIQKKISFNNLNPRVCHSGDLKSPQFNTMMGSLNTRYICK